MRTDKTRLGRGGRIAIRCAAVGLGLTLDRLVGEPSFGPHPVGVLGSWLAAAERRWYGDRVARGAVFAASSTGVAALFGYRITRIAPLFGLATLTWLASAGRMLAEAGNDIGAALAAADLDLARQRLPNLVGRDPAQLNEAEIVRAVVESLAENTVDAVVAPAFWALLAGGAGVVAHRTVNTLDAMVGHRSLRYERFGKASARLDDVMAWLPARLTALILAALQPGRAGAVWKSVRTQAPAHPSPNSGVAEAAAAAVLGVTLGGTNRYGNRVETRPALGSGPAPERGHIAEAVELVGRVERAVALCCGVAAVLAIVGSRRRQT